MGRGHGGAAVSQGENAEGGDAGVGMGQGGAAVSQGEGAGLGGKCWV